jgi:hypothetical protein
MRGSKTTRARIGLAGALLATVALGTGARVVGRGEEPKTNGVAPVHASVAAALPAVSPCPDGMAPVPTATFDGRPERNASAVAFCIDRFEASLVAIAPDGREEAVSPFGPVKDDDAERAVKAVSVRGVHPQAYVSAIVAKRACGRAGKRLCTPREWVTACKGPQNLAYPYGNERRARACNDYGKSPVIELYGAPSSAKEKSFWSAEKLNDPALNQLDGTLAKTGTHPKCANELGVFDMVGNLHEWVDDPAGAFYGGYYQDTRQQGEGCNYKTTAHEAGYHDYSTGFRCCSDPLDAARDAGPAP